MQIIVGMLSVGLLCSGLKRESGQVLCGVDQGCYTVPPPGNFATVSGGSSNTAGGLYATVGGGRSNRSLGYAAATVGWRLLPNDTEWDILKARELKEELQPVDKQAV